MMSYINGPLCHISERVYSVTSYFKGPFFTFQKEFAQLAFDAAEVEDLLIGEVGVKDFGENDNTDIGLRYGANKENFPGNFLIAVSNPYTDSTTNPSTHPSTKLRRLGLPNRIIDELDSKPSGFDCRLQ